MEAHSSNVGIQLQHFPNSTMLKFMAVVKLVPTQLVAGAAEKVVYP